MLDLYRRHLPTCPHKEKGRAYRKCDCPLHCDGEVRGQRIRQSLKTTNYDRAKRRLAELEAEIETGKVRKSVTDATAAFIAAQDAQPTTMHKYRRIMNRLVEFSKSAGVDQVDAFTLEHLDCYKQSRPISPLTWQKELQTLRGFWDFCVKRKWCQSDPASDMRMPKEPKAKPREPYTDEEIFRIFEAARTYGLYDYERKRATAMVHLLAAYGLRIGDVVRLRRDQIVGDAIELYATKNGKHFMGKLTPQVIEALSALPLPNGATADCPYFFWNGKGQALHAVKVAIEGLRSVYRKSGVENAISHRFRHTLATNILVNGGTIEDAANALGDDPAIVRKHYAKFSQELQRNAQSVMDKVHARRFGTSAAHNEKAAQKAAIVEHKLVPKVGVEPTWGVNPGRF